MNAENAKQDTAQEMSEQDPAVPYNADGSLSFYWYDAHEENYGAEIYLFGKVMQTDGKILSCTLIINGM